MLYPVLGALAFAALVGGGWCVGWAWDLLVDAIATGCAVAEWFEGWEA